MQSADVLGECALPRNRHGQEQRVERSIVEAFSEVAAGRKHQSFLCIRPFQTFLGYAPLRRVHAAVQDDQVAREFFQSCAEVFEMIASLRQDHWPAPGLQAEQYIVEDQIIALLILRQRSIERRHL